MIKAVKAIYGFLASYALSCVLFFLLLVLTLLGTLEQVEHGLYATQKKYFESLYLVHEFFGRIPVLLPGVRLLLILLFVNLLCGALLRLRGGWSRVGVYIAHLGILFMLVGSFITYEYSLDGHLTLYEKERSNEFQSYRDWEIAVTEVGADGKGVQHIIPARRFEHPAQEDAATFVFPKDTPRYELTVTGYSANTSPAQAGPGMPSNARVIDGVYLKTLPPEKEAEQNAAGAYVTLRDMTTGASHEGILWGFARSPWTVAFDSQTLQVDLRKQTWQLPFTIVLDKFTRELHPRTNMPKTFMSDVTRIDGDKQQQVKITMNEPMRYQGYTFYQASWGPSNAGPNTRLYSTLAVVKNPADQFPLYACIIISFGLMIHFLVRLIHYLRQEQARDT